MTPKEKNIRRINNLDFQLIQKLDYETLAILTSDFSESLVRKLIARSKSLAQQELIFRYVKNNFEKWNRHKTYIDGPTRFPEYFKDIQTDLNCKLLIKDEEEAEEADENIEELPATQKVRMELALLLLKKAGLTDEVLSQQGNKQKAATIMATLLDIHSNNKKGNEAQTCATYISARDLSRDRHEQIIENINSLLKELNIDIQI